MYEDSVLCKSKGRVRNTRFSKTLGFYLFNIAYVSIVFMYFKITPLAAETQPIVILLLVPIGLFFGREQLKNLDQNRKLLLVFWTVLLIYGLFSMVLFRQTFSLVFSYSLRLLIMPLAYLLFLRNVAFLHPNSVKFVLYTLFFVACIEVFEIPFLDDLLYSMYSGFFERYSFGDGSRGLCILTPEPSYFVYFALLLLYSIDFLRSNGRISRRKGFLYRLMVIGMSFFTKSALVYLAIIVYLFFHALKAFWKKRFAGVVLVSALLLIPLLGFLVFELPVPPSVNNRFEEAFFNAIVYLRGRGVFETLFYADASGGFRLLINLIYCLSLVLYPFGKGYGGISTKWEQIAEFFGIDLLKNGHFAYSVVPGSALDAQAYIPNLIGTIGLFAFLFVVFLYTSNKQKDIWLRRSLLFSLTLFLWFLQSNFFNPVFWVLVGFLKSQNIKMSMPRRSFCTKVAEQGLPESHGFIPK